MCSFYLWGVHNNNAHTKDNMQQGIQDAVFHQQNVNMQWTAWNFNMQ